jgi:hypothetical protein
MKGHALAALLIAASHSTSAADPGEWRDLNLKMEPLGEPVLVNGVPMTISRVTGSDVGVFAQRMGDKWLVEGGVHGVRSTNSGRWTIISRLHGNGLEVLQWTGTGKDAQLLWSRSDLQSRTRPKFRGVLRFPTGCVPGRAVSGRVDTRSYWQQAAHCKGSTRNVLSSVRAIASTQGFAVQSWDSQLLARSGNTEITVLAWPADDDPALANTSLVYLRLDPPGVAP